MAKKKSQSDAASREAKIARLEDFQEAVTPQLELFGLAHLDKLDKERRIVRNRYSNTIELYDFTPKYVWGKQNRINGRFLDPIKREYVCRKEHYRVTISPARIEHKDGVFRDHFPGKREELVEDALRKIATRGQAVMLNELVSVKFTFYELQQELKRNGHSYSVNELKEALTICGGTHLTITSSDGSSVLMSSMFECIGMHSREEWKGSGKKSSAFVRFNSLVTAGINNRQFRLYNYDQVMSYSSSIARQLHKRMSHHYKQAGLFDPFTIHLKTIIRDFGLTSYAQLRDNLRDVEMALYEMGGEEVDERGQKIEKPEARKKAADKLGKEKLEKRVIMSYRIERLIDATKHNKLIDAKIIITPDHPFISEVKAATERAKEVQSLPLKNGN